MSDENQNWYLVVSMNGIQGQPVKFASRDKALEALDAAVMLGRFEQVVEEPGLSQGNKMVMMLGPGASLLVVSERHMNAQRMLSQGGGHSRIVPGRS